MKKIWKIYNFVKVTILDWKKNFKKIDIPHAHGSSIYSESIENIIFVKNKGGVTRNLRARKITQKPNIYLLYNIYITFPLSFKLALRLARVEIILKGRIPR